MLAERAIELRKTACPMDCPDTCSLEVEVQEGRIQSIRGTRENPTTAGFICSKVANFGRRVYSPERLLYPMKRIGLKGKGSFSRVSWEEALTLITDRFREIITTHGGEAILPYSYGGSNSMLGQDTVDRAYFAKLGASRLNRTVCAAPTGAVSQGMYGKMAGVAFQDYEHAGLILIWGANPKASNIHLVPFLKKAKARGAKIAVVDPRCNFSESEIDLHIPVLPGTDLVVALAMIHHWHQNGLLDWDFVERHTTGHEVLLAEAANYSMEKAASIAGVSAKEIEKLAMLYAESNPAVIRVGWGLERNKNGGQAIATILAMPALMGKFGVQGGGYTLSNKTATVVREEDLVDAPEWNTRLLNMNLLGKLLLEEKNPPLLSLFVYNANPAATVPNQNAIIQGLMREDLFTVVFDQVMTDTALFADVLLPAVTFLEQKEIKRSYGSYALQYISPVIDRCGEAKPNEEVFALLGRAMGWCDTAFVETTEDYLKRAARAIEGMGEDVSLEKLRSNRILFFNFPGNYPVQFQTVFPRTPDRKAHLSPECLGESPYVYDEIRSPYRFTLISPSTNKMINSSLGEYNFSELYVMIHPEDAASLGLQKGSRVRVFNDSGEVHCVVRLSSQVRKNVVVIPKGAWRKSSLNGQTATALAPDLLGMAGGACFNDARVNVAALP